MSFEVHLTRDAERDLQEIVAYIAAAESPEVAMSQLGQLESLIASLGENPERGSYPNELLSLGIREFRQLHFKPWRLIYRVIGPHVYLYLVADGRRDMQSLMQRRLLG